MRSRSVRFLGTLCFLVCTLACAGELTPEAAREKIDDEGVPFDENGLLQAIGAADNELLRLFMVAGFDPNRGVESKPAPLALAAARANLPAIKLLIDAGASAKELPGVLNNPAQRGDIPAMELLLEAGADPESVDHLGQTALVAAVNHARVDSTRFLLEAGGKPNGQRGSGQRPLILAARLDSLELIELLIDAGAKVDVAGGYPRTTPLSVAAKHGRMDIVEVLLERGADPSFSAQGTTAARVARGAGHEEIARRIEQAASN